VTVSNTALVKTCKGNGVDAYRSLTDLFKILPYARSADDYEALLPWKQPTYGKHRGLDRVIMQGRGQSTAYICTDRAVFGQNCLGTLAAGLVRRSSALGSTRQIAKM
jgi:hypothetical protein